MQDELINGSPHVVRCTKFTDVKLSVAYSSTSAGVYEFSVNIKFKNHNTARLMRWFHTFFPPDLVHTNRNADSSCCHKGISLCECIGG